jgi:hypothetical protein
VYQVKYEVLRLQEELHQVRDDIRQDRVALHVLEAEWAYLNWPERLRRLAAEHLDMGPTEAKQVAAVTALPPRISDPEPAVRAASAAPGDGAGETAALPLPRAKPWSLEQPAYARAARPTFRPDAGERDEVDKPLRRARAQVAARDPGAAADRNAGSRATKRTTTNNNTNNTAGQVGQSKGSEGPETKASPPRSRASKPRQIAVGDVLIQVGARP